MFYISIYNYVIPLLKSKNRLHLVTIQIIIIIIITIIMDKELYVVLFSIRLPWMVNSIPSPMATSSWLSSLALFLSLYASNSPSARSRSPSRSIPSAQSYKISNPPLLGNSYRKTNRNALKIMRNPVQIKIRSLYIQAHLIHTCAIVFRRNSQYVKLNNQIELVTWSCCLHAIVYGVIYVQWYHQWPDLVWDGVSTIYNVDALCVILAALILILMVVKLLILSQ